MEILKDDILSSWKQLFSDPDIVGPVYVANEQQWRVDMRSTRYRSACKTSRLGITGMLFEFDIPPEIVEQLKLNELIIEGELND